MAVTDEKETSVIATDTTEENEREYDITKVLETTGHLVHTYENGLVLGVRLEGISGTRGVHLDIVQILDLRKAEFGKTSLAMRAAVLESVNRSLESLLRDVGLSDFLEEQIITTGWGRIRIPILGSDKHGSRSMIHETRTVYVIVRDTKPSTDFSWLTESKRIVTPDEFAIMRMSDTKSVRGDLKNFITSEKWKLLESGFKYSWLGVIFSIIIFIGLGSIAGVLLLNNGDISVPIIAVIAGIIIGGVFLSYSRKTLSEFRDIVASEEQRLSEMCDKTRIEESVFENQDNMRLLGDLNFIVSPLMAKAGNALSEGKLDVAITAACSVMDECMRLSSTEFSSDSALVGGDEGLAKFVGFFGNLGATEYETDLALAYVALTGFALEPISAEEAITHIGTLNNALYHIGALRPDVKEIIDDLLNSRAGMEAVEYLDGELSKPMEPIPDPRDVKEEEITEEQIEESSSLDDLKEFIIESDSISESDADLDDISTTGSDIVTRRMTERTGEEEVE